MPRDQIRPPWCVATVCGVLLLEFTIEPFVEGQPGPHVTTAVAAVQELGVAVDLKAVPPQALRVIELTGLTELLDAHA